MQRIFRSAAEAIGDTLMNLRWRDLHHQSARPALSYDYVEMRSIYTLSVADFIELFTVNGQIPNLVSLELPSAPWVERVLVEIARRRATSEESTARGPTEPSSTPVQCSLEAQSQCSPDELEFHPDGARRIVGCTV